MVKVLPLPVETKLVASVILPPLKARAPLKLMALKLLTKPLVPTVKLPVPEVKVPEPVKVPLTVKLDEPEAATAGFEPTLTVQPVPILVAAEAVRVTEVKVVVWPQVKVVLEVPVKTKGPPWV
jgi:hypothetical protein